MKNTKLLSLSILSLAAFSGLTSSALARTFDNIIRPYTSARSSAMGGVRYSTGLYDENFFGNPARMVDNPKWRIDIVNMLVELNSGSMANVGKLTASGDKIENLASTAGTNNHVRIQTVIPAYYSPHFLNDKNALAVGLIQSTQADISLRKNMAMEPNVFMDIGPAVTFARKFKEDRLAVGVTAHYMYRAATKETFSTVDYIKGTGFKSVSDIAGEGTKLDFDVGARHNVAWRPHDWDIQTAFAINNLIGSKYKEGIDLISGVQPSPTKQPRTYNAGVAARKPHAFGFGGDTTVAVEIQDVGNNSGGSPFRLLHIGSEVALKDTIFLRAGLNQGYLGLGVGFDLPVLKLDLATYGEEMSLNTGGQEDRRYVMRIGFAI